MGERVPSLFGIMAEFADDRQLLVATQAAVAAGYRHLDAYAPFPVPEVSRALSPGKSSVPKWALVGGIIGLITGYVMQWYSAVFAYPIHVGGKPLHSIPAFMLITFELTILSTAFFTVGGMLWANRLPKYYHPVFHVEAFRRVNVDGFFLCIEAADPLFRHEQTQQMLTKAGALHVYDIPV